MSYNYNYQQVPPAYTNEQQTVVNVYGQDSEPLEFKKTVNQSEISIRMAESITLGYAGMLLYGHSTNHLFLLKLNYVIASFALFC
ncbi:hypothetical protein AYI69_g2591 [Smittium culicis]|uniref:Uncharacterized protein n=1 Tax=Smittium culicis TaxID=133412 RepID=A0A1R1YM57_9FUNG|nr:hypothetical protein AYI69_g2591 [Smittium culicis]